MTQKKKKLAETFKVVWIDHGYNTKETLTVVQQLTALIENKWVKSDGLSSTY